MISSGLIWKLPKSSGSDSPVMEALVIPVRVYASLGAWFTSLSSEVAEVGHRHSGDFVWVNPEIAMGF